MEAGTRCGHDARMTFDRQGRAPVLCGVDDSDSSRVAVRVAAVLADRLAAPLALVHVLRPGPVASPVAAYHLAAARSAMVAAGEDLLDRVAQRADVAGARRQVVEALHPSRGLLAAARQEGARLLVVGSRGRGPLASALLGSVSEPVARQSHCPVVTVPPDVGFDWGEDNASPAVVCGASGSRADLPMLQVAGGLARRLRWRLVIVHVDEPPPGGPRTLVASDADESHVDGLGCRATVRAVSEAAYEAGVGDADILLEHGEPVAALRRAADAQGALLMVVGTQGRGPMRAALLGSVSRRLGMSAPVPVLMVPLGAPRSPAAAAQVA
jgi:nucleotide-binding universal stress UspA family protein